MARQGQSFDDYLASYKENAAPADLEAYQAAFAHYALANELIEQRKALGLTQVGLAAASGVSQPEISRIERGVNNPTLETLSRLALVLGVRVGLIRDSRLVVRTTRGVRSPRP